jgi:hypothetical protein
MPDTDGATGASGQAAQFGSEVLTELQAAVRMAETPAVLETAPAPQAPYTGPEFDAAHPEGGSEPAAEPVSIPATEQAPEPIPTVAAESPKLTHEQAARIQDIVDRAKADIARIVAEYEAKRKGFAGDLMAQQEEERKRKAQELVAKIQAGGTPTP